MSTEVMLRSCRNEKVLRVAQRVFLSNIIWTVALKFRAKRIMFATPLPSMGVNRPDSIHLTLRLRLVGLRNRLCTTP